MIKENILFTPSVKTGCYRDVIRQEVIRLSNDIEMKVVEAEDLKPKYVLQMDEIFFASETKGIQWVLGFENRRYVHQHTDRIYAALNQFLEKKTENQK